MLNKRKIKSLIIGHAIGDALGVPVEFQQRHTLKEDPVVNMREYGSHNVPAGTWSDDTSLTLGLLESLGRLGTIDYDDIMKNFIRWMDYSEFTATDLVFDIGIATREALMEYSSFKKPPLICGSSEEYSNGNGSLMRISPMALYLYVKSENNLTAEDIKLTHNISKLTHAHIRSQMGCGIYVFIAVEIIAGRTFFEAVKIGIEKAYDYYSSLPKFAREITLYGRLWDIEKFKKLPEYEIKSTGYVLYSLEAAIWCLLNADNYAECVLKAVNLGDDTDTVGAITGGLAGLYYGLDKIPSDFKNTLKKYDYIDNLCDKFAEKFGIL